MLKVRTLFTVAACALAATAMSPQPASAQGVTELRFHTFLPPVANPIKTFYGPWAEKVNKASGGKLKVTIYPAMQLGGAPPQLAEQVKDGVVDIVWTLPSYSTGRFPKVEAIELPFVATDAHATTLALQDFQKKHLQDEFADYHVLLLHVHDGDLFMSKKPIRKASDFRGLKIRILNKAGARSLGALGASPIGAPLPEIPQMLSKGVIDATILPYEIAPAIKLQELVTYFSIMEGEYPRFHTGVFSFLMNKKAYAGLSADLRKVIDDNSGANIADEAGKNWVAIETPGKKVMESKDKNKFYTIPAAEVEKIRAASNAAIEKWIEEMDEKGYDGQLLYDDAVAMVDKYTKKMN